MANTLIVEHLTIYNVMLGVYAVAFTFFKYKKICIQHLSYLAGTIAGTIIMFSNGAYHAAASGTDTYRTISANSSIFKRIAENFKEISIQGFLNNFVLLGQRPYMNFGVYEHKSFSGHKCKSASEKWM